MSNSDLPTSFSDAYGLSELAADLEQFQPHHVQIYLITRQLKAGHTTRSRAPDRFDFRPYRVDADSALQTYVMERVNTRMRTFLSQHYELTPFEVFPPEESRMIFRSPREGEVGAFRDLIDLMIGDADIASQRAGADEIRLNRENADAVLPLVWAYCVKFQPDDPTQAPSWCFQRYSPARIAGMEGKKKVLGFDFTTNAELKLLTGPTLIFDCHINCLFHQDQFYIFDKDKFEEIAGLDEQYQQRADEIISVMSSGGIVKGLQHLSEACKKNSVLRNRFIQLGQRGEHTSIYADRLAKMLATARRHSKELPLDVDGNIELSCLQDAKLLAELLDDAYLESEQTGYLYNASRKRRTVV